MRLLFLVMFMAGLAVQAQELSSVASADGTEIFYQTYGSGDPVFVLSGGPGLNPQYLIPVAEKIAKTHQAILIHQRGTGKSLVPSVDSVSMSMKNYVADLEAVRQAIGTDKVIMAGHSWGGMMSMEYASARPGSISKIILIAPGGPDDAFFSYFGANIQKGLHPDDHKEIQQLQEAGKPTLRGLYPGYFYSRERALATRPAIDWETINGQDNVNVATLNSYVAGVPVRLENLGRLDTPVVIIQGRQDPIGEPTAHQIGDLIPNTEIHWIESCGHFPWLENEPQQQEFERLLTEALR